ncbi:MAG: MliC family protein [Dinoroseobacter sp.]|nr:MliC family protein [Dinoroseobacter sp.]
MRSLVVVLAERAGSAFAETGPSFDCAHAESSAEKLVCADPDLARLDRLVAERYSAALAAARGLDAGAVEAEANLKAYQRGWIKGRDDCWKAQDEHSCVVFQYQFREAELVTAWMLEAPQQTAFWACGGSAANEVVTMFFDTEVPSVRFERGDSVDTGILTETASGARYEGTFGRSIWIKGEEAQYRDPDPDGTQYRCVLRGTR